MSQGVKLSRAQWVVSATFAVLVAILLWLSLVFFLQYLDKRSEVKQLEPKLARFYGLVKSEDQLQRAEARASNELSLFVYPSDADTGALGTSMQQRVRVLMADAGLSVSGSQVLPAKRHNDFTRINISVNLEGDLADAVQAFIAIELAEPLIFIESIEIKPQRRRRGNLEQVADIQIRLFSLQVYEP